MKIVHPKAGHLQFEELKTFICQGKKHGWASGAHPINLPNGDKRYSFRMGDLNYVDTYQGEQGFMGRELVTFKGVPIWGMHYSGAFRIPDTNPDGIQPAFFEGEVNRFLRERLMSVSVDFPFRGPAVKQTDVSTSIGWLTYENIALVDSERQGDDIIRNFIGREHIDFMPVRRAKKSAVFRLNYHGRILVPDDFICK